tara:strand:+ start:2379 stop:3059 length:681 start_codon:yes stop_codon:yes gene_type:complete
MNIPTQLRRIYTKLLPLWLRQRIESTLLPAYPREYDKNQYIFIHIPKTAGKSIISKLHNRGATHLSYSDYEDILGDKINDYFVFTVLRDPADRFASAYSYLKAGGNQSREDQEFSHRWIKNKDINDFIKTSFTASEVRNSLFFRSQASFLKKKNDALATVKILDLNNLKRDFVSISDRLGVSSELPYLNESHSIINAFSEESRLIIQTVYREDYALINSTINSSKK